MCIDNEPKVLDGMDALLGGWGCRVLKAPDVATAIAAITESQAAPNGLLVDYHLDRGNGLDAIAELRRRFSADLPAILITADRSPHVRDAARAQDVQVLSKPLKPASPSASPRLNNRRVVRHADVAEITGHFFWRTPSRSSRGNTSSRNSGSSSR